LLEVLKFLFPEKALGCGGNLLAGLVLLFKENLGEEYYSRNRRRGGNVEKLRGSLFVRELDENAVRKMGTGERVLCGRKPRAGRFGRVVHRMHRGCTEGK
jgi:hypothetical protein